MLDSTGLKIMPYDVAAVIGLFVVLFAVYIFANVVAHVWVYGFISESFIPDLISSIMLHRLK